MRYDNTPKLAINTRYGTSESVHRIRLAISSNSVPYRESILTESQRLDVLAGIEYGNSSYWWIIAAASNIGWGLQVPPGKSIKIPDLKKILEVI